MSTQAWIALFTTIGAVIALIKYGFSEYVKVTDKVLDKESKAHGKTIDDFESKVKTIEMQYQDTLKKIEAAKHQMALAQKQYSETNQTLKVFVELTKSYIKDNEDKLKELNEKLGKVILVGK